MLSAQELAALDTIYPDGIYCIHCGERDIVPVGPADNYWCPECDTILDVLEGKRITPLVIDDGGAPA